MKTEQYNIDEKSSLNQTTTFSNDLFIMDPKIHLNDSDKKQDES